MFAETSQPIHRRQRGARLFSDTPHPTADFQHCVVRLDPDHFLQDLHCFRSGANERRFLGRADHVHLGAVVGIGESRPDRLVFRSSGPAFRFIMLAHLDL